MTHATHLRAEPDEGRSNLTGNVRDDQKMDSEWVPPEGSWASTAGNRRSMRSNRGRDTAPELAVRRRLHNRGFRFRVSYRPVPSLRRTADIAFTRKKIAVFIDGCFWHGCPEHRTHPKTNAEFWRAKIEGNVSRDEDTTRSLTTAGWTVLRFWAHEPPEEVADRIASYVGAEGCMSASTAADASTAKRTSPRV